MFSPLLPNASSRRCLPSGLSLQISLQLSDVGMCLGLSNAGCQEFQHEGTCKGKENRITLLPKLLVCCNFYKFV
ncbi:hypothetical protein BRADI_3g19611v3 [Brachypodium distachyon]|uniref:Uncharacterized protein n=1 Tax=Brachypodium distachyon TaxID=15368 RepID=A0A0Q3F7X9_BRADI|nr:hypothetical protein BRADI_3g19611v3 [Brachypodium distachyon]